jgi:CO/xanthine dehydrogenase Mo-binding subunit
LGVRVHTMPFTPESVIAALEDGMG